MRDDTQTALPGKRLVGAFLSICLILTTSLAGCIVKLDTNSVPSDLPPSTVSVPLSAPVPDWPVPGVMSKPKPVVVVAAAPPLRMIYSRLGIDTSVLNLELTDAIRQGDITWPNQPEAYWVDLWGMPGDGASDMTVIVGHSCSGLNICQRFDWQFTKLSNHAQLGDVINVITKNGIVHYTVDQIVARIPKSELPQHAEIFGTAPMSCRLVIITCDTNDIHAENYVVTARRESCS